MAVDDMADVIRRLPKVELHSHLDGSLRATTVIELARKNGVELPTYDSAQVYPSGYDPDSFFRTLWAASSVIITPADYARVTYEALCDAVTAGNVRYTEMFFQATVHPKMTYSEMLEGILDGVSAAETDTGVRCNLIPAINRGQSPAVARRLVEDVVAHRPDKVLGIGIDGDNYIGPAERFVEAFSLAKQNGLYCTAHAGLPIEDTKTALDLLQCDRIDHGYYVLRDPELLKRVVEERIHHTACWTLASHYFPTSPVESPIQQMVDAGVSTSINTDDPPIFHTDIGTEYVATAQTLGWDVDTVWARIIDAIDGTWLPEDERNELRSQLTEEMMAVVGVSDRDAANHGA